MSPQELVASLEPLTDDEVARVVALLSLVEPDKVKAGGVK